MAMEFGPGDSYNREWGHSGSPKFAGMVHFNSCPILLQDNAPEEIPSQSPEPRIRIYRKVGNRVVVAAEIERLPIEPFLSKEGQLKALNLYKKSVLLSHALF